jgi:hypothetical protein
LATDVDLTAQELVNAKQAGLQTVKDCYGAIDLTVYSETEIAALNAETKALMESIENAATVEAVNELVAGFMEKYGAEEPTDDEVVTSTDKGCNGMVAGLSVAAAITLAGACVVAAKKKED